MVRRNENLTHLFNEHMKGGTGTVEVIRVLEPGEYESGIKLIAKLVLRPGCSLGYHTHEGEEEIIHVLSGCAVYNDDGAMNRLSAGDSCVCLSGHGHSIACAPEAEEPLVVYAVINKV